MATCKLLLEENRNVFKGGKMNLSIRVTEKGKSKYLVLAKMTQEQYREIFVKKSMDTDAVKFRGLCNEKLAKAEKITCSMAVVDLNEVVRKFKDKDLPDIQKGSLKLVDMCERYIDENNHLAYKTKGLYRYAGRCLSRNQPEILITDVTAEFLQKQERKRSEQMSLQSYSSVVRHIRSVINYFKNKGCLPVDYKYPFGRGGYQIPSYTPMKHVMANDEIKCLLSAELTAEQKYAVDIWELLYRCNGINFADLLRMRWDNKKNNCFVFLRKKTENTRRMMQKEVVVPITGELNAVLERVGDKESPFILGLLKESYTEENFDYISRKNRKAINKVLGEISSDLNLSVPLKLKTARDVYATVLKRNGASIEKISEMLSHADIKTTRHYLSSMNHEEVFQVNSLLI